MKRAVGERQKEERRQSILDQAGQVLLARDYLDLTLAEVARGLDLVKGTLYRYFPTKESLVLEVLEAQLATWMGGLEEDLGAVAPVDVGSLARVVARSLASRPVLIRLLGILNVVLEQNVPLERLVAFKRQTARALAQGARLLEGACPALAGRGEAAGLAIFELAIGCVHLSSRGPDLDRALDEPGLRSLRLDFEPLLSQTLAWLLQGLCASD